MFDLALNGPGEVALVRFHGHVSPQDFAALDAAVMVSVLAEAATDCIYDFSEVESFNLPVPFVADRAQHPPIWPSRRSVFVAPHVEIEVLIRLFAAYQAVIGCHVPAIVHTLGDALALLHCRRSGFRPIENTWLRASIATDQSAYVH